jgi:hypothetical protein
MRLADTDPMAVLPVTAACARATFARVTDAHRDHSERRQQLIVLQACLVSMGRLLDRCHSETARLASDMAELDPSSDRCLALWPVCGHCAGVPLSPSGERADCPRCGRLTVLPPSGRSCEDPPTVKIRDSTGAQQMLCLSHAAAAIRHVDRLSVVSASRGQRAVLNEIARESNIVRRRVSRLSDTVGWEAR